MHVYVEVSEGTGRMIQNPGWFRILGRRQGEGGNWTKKDPCAPSEGADEWRDGFVYWLVLCEVCPDDLGIERGMRGRDGRG